MPPQPGFLQVNKKRVQVHITAKGVHTQYFHLYTDAKPQVSDQIKEK